MPRIAQCPETEEPCDDGRCKIGSCYLENQAAMQRERRKLLCPRVAVMAKVRRDASRRVWLGMDAADREALADEAAPLIAESKRTGVTQEQTGEQREAAMIDALLRLPAYADRIQAQVDIILRGYDMIQADSSLI